MYSGVDFYIESRVTTEDCRTKWRLKIQYGGLLETCRDKVDYMRLQGLLGT